MSSLIPTVSINFNLIVVNPMGAFVVANKVLRVSCYYWIWGDVS